jgi:hypothetical protein
MIPRKLASAGPFIVSFLEISLNAMISLEKQARGHVWLRIVLLDVGRSVFCLEQLDNFLNLSLVGYRSEFTVERLSTRADLDLGISKDVLVPLRVCACDGK